MRQGHERERERGAEEGKGERDRQTDRRTELEETGTLDPMRNLSHSF